jgi:hypothetical protein
LKIYPIDFYKPACQDITSSRLFGLCDDEDVPPAKTPAYLDEINSPIWIAEISNPTEKDVTFTAVDNCVEILRPNGEMDNRCDVMLTTSEDIIFIELKDRISTHKWVAEGGNQLYVTINHFIANHAVAHFIRKRAYLANKQRPYFNNSVGNIAQKISDDTGFIFQVKRQIEI